MDEKLELLKLAEECGELVQVCMKSSLNNKSYKDRMIEEMGDVLCHLKRTANVLGIGWDEIQQRSYVKNEKVNKHYYVGEKVNVL